MEPITYTKKYKYEKIIDHIQSAIDKDIFKTNEKLPSLRKITREFNCAISVAMQAYMELEIRGQIHAIEKSGFFVSPQLKHKIPSPQKVSHKLEPKISKSNALAKTVIDLCLNKSIINFGAGVPDQALLPINRLKKSLIKTCREQPELLSQYSPPNGYDKLRQELAYLMLNKGISIAPEEFIITNGCSEAVAVAIKAVTRKGDTIAIESPVFFGIINILEHLERKVIEIPTSPETGIDLISLEQLIQNQKISACIISAVFQNPLSFIMPRENKIKLVNMATQYNIPIIEDDLYGECSFNNKSYHPLKYFDSSGIVLYCSSFSKTISPGSRTGWLISGQYQVRCESIKIAETFGGPVIIQAAMADFLHERGYDYHIKKLKKDISVQTHQIKQLILRHFPRDIKITNPEGGYFLWVELNKEINTMELFHKAVKKKISIIPGPIFTTENKYQNCLRISCGSPITQKTEYGIKTIADMI